MVFAMRELSLLNDSSMARAQSTSASKRASSGRVRRAKSVAQKWGREEHMASRPIGVYSPLHSVLRHFVKRLVGALGHAGVEWEILASRNGEVGRDRVRKALSLGAHIVNARRRASQVGTTVVAWPLLGWWEVPLWRGDHRTLIVMHDPMPLSPQHGLSAASGRRAALLAGTQRPGLITMSPEATEVTRRFFPETLLHELGHPMCQPSMVVTGARTDRVLVLGQYKPARDLDIMARIAAPLRAGGWQPTLAGRGWPSMAGWDVVGGFLSEAEFDDLLGSAAAVLLPYKYYFQSGVALRALENGTPVVGRETGFLSQILGQRFPGAVEHWDDPEAWVRGVHNAVEQRDIQLIGAAQYSLATATQWVRLLSEDAPR